MILLVIFVLSVIYYSFHSKILSDFEFYILCSIFLIVLILLNNYTIKEHFVDNKLSKEKILLLSQNFYKNAKNYIKKHELPEKMIKVKDTLKNKLTSLIAIYKEQASIKNK